MKNSKLENELGKQIFLYIQNYEIYSCWIVYFVENNNDESMFKILNILFIYIFVYYYVFHFYRIYFQ
jgi:hypothetical protein